MYIYFSVPACCAVTTPSLYLLFAFESLCSYRLVASQVGLRATAIPSSYNNNCGEWVECMGVASGSGWNLQVCLLGVVVRRYIDFLILLILYLFFFAAASLLFVHLKNVFRSCSSTFW